MGDIASLQCFVPATCPVKFSELNSVQNVVGTKLLNNSRCTNFKLSGHTRGLVATLLVTCTLYNFVCVYGNVILPLLHIPATRPLFVNSTWFWGCNKSLRYAPTSWPLVWGKLNGLNDRLQHVGNTTKRQQTIPAQTKKKDNHFNFFAGIISLFKIT